MGLRFKREVRPDPAVAVNQEAVLTLPDLPELPPGRGRDEDVHPRLELSFGMTYREARSLYRAYRVQRRKLERSKQKSTFIAGTGQRDAAMDAIHKARALEVRLFDFVESFIGRSEHMPAEDEGLETLASAVQAALMQHGEFEDVVVLNDGDGPFVRAYNDEYGHEFALMIEPS
jgi:hypothetical protein